MGYLYGTVAEVQSSQDGVLVELVCPNTCKAEHWPGYVS